jgi:hypothetical protein
MASDAQTLQQKVIKEKYTAIPMSVDKVFTDIIQKCL